MNIVIKLKYLKILAERQNASLTLKFDYYNIIVTQDEECAFVVLNSLVVFN